MYSLQRCLVRSPHGKEIQEAGTDHFPIATALHGRAIEVPQLGLGAGILSPKLS